MWSLSSPSDKRHQVEISPWITVFSVFFVLGVYFVYYIRSILVMVFLAIILMAALNPAVVWFQKRLKLPRMAGVGLAYTLFITTLLLLGSLIIPPLITELQKLSIDGQLPLLKAIEDEIRNYRFTIGGLQSFFEQVSTLGNSLDALVKIITPPIQGIFNTFTVLVISIYLLADREHLHKKLNWFTRNPDHLKQAESFIDKIESQLGGWVRGQLILMAVIGVITYIGLLILGIPYALPLALLAAILEILPNLGPIIASIPAIVLGAYTGGFFLGGVTTLFYFIVQQLENNLIVPRIMKANADVNPLVAILIILIGFKVGNVAGALLSIPFYIILRSFYSWWLSNRRTS